MLLSQIFDINIDELLDNPALQEKSLPIEKKVSTLAKKHLVKIGYLFLYVSIPGLIGVTIMKMLVGKQMEKVKAWSPTSGFNMDGFGSFTSPFSLFTNALTIFQGLFLILLVVEIVLVVTNYRKNKKAT